MFRLENVLQLKPNEEIRLVAKRHAATIFLRLVIAFLLIVVPFFFLFFLFRKGAPGMSAFFVSVFVGLFFAWRTLAMWDGDTFVVSNERVVKVLQAGIFSRTVTESALTHLLDVAWSKRGIFGTVFNYGDISMTTVGQQKLVAGKLSDPKYIHALLAAAIEEAHAARESAESAHAARVERISAHIGRLNDEELSAFERSLSLGGDKKEEKPEERGYSHGNGIAVEHIHADDFDRLKSIEDV